MSFILEPSWQKILQAELDKPYMRALEVFVEQERAQNGPIYPPEPQVFSAFTYTPFDQVRVVIVGQDPYHGPQQAHGLCFSVPEGIKAPPSLKNIFKELKEDLGIPIPQHGCLLKWALQGVLLLNATLTVKESKPLSHHKKGWETFTDKVIEILAIKKEPIIFVLWGNNAMKKCKEIPGHHTILTAAHPSPLSAYAGFLGCKHFSQINKILDKPIDWQLD